MGQVFVVSELTSQRKGLLAVIAVLRNYGHQDWANDCARQLTCALALGLRPSVSEAHEIVSRVNGGEPGQRYVIPSEATAEALAAWKAAVGGGV